MTHVIARPIESRGAANGRVRSIHFNVAHMAAITFAAPVVIAAPAAANRLPTMRLPAQVQPDRAVLVDARLAALSDMAAEEGIAIDAGSRAALLGFLHGQPSCRAPAIMLEDDGSLRAIWRAGREQVALHFRGDGRVQFVMFVAQAEKVDRAAGLVGPKRLSAQLAAYDVDHLLGVA